MNKTFDEFFDDMNTRKGFHFTLTDWNTDWCFEVWSPRWDLHWEVKYRKQGVDKRSSRRNFDTLGDVLAFIQNPKHEETLQQKVDRLESILERAVDKYPELKELIDGRAGL